MNVDALLDWYARVRRPLPWRETTDPYAILVSEVMLQQTQATRVVPYYDAFLDRFPHVRALARAPVSEVLAAWSGLGYNRRALALQRAAQVVDERGWPEDLTELPAVGAYTAAAVASFAFGAQVAAVDTNVRRVLARQGGQRSAGELLPPGRAADFNQAMMELGALVCRPRRPVCDACPVAGGCARAVAPAPRRRSPRFEDTDRWARGKVLAAHVHGTAPPELDPARRRRAEEGLVRDGLLVRGTGGELRLP